MNYRCDECGRETVASFQPFCTCEKGSPMTEVPVPPEEEKLPKVIQVFGETGQSTSYGVLLDNGEVWRTYRTHEMLLSNEEVITQHWERVTGPPCTLPEEEKKDA